MKGPLRVLALFVSLAPFSGHELEGAFVQTLASPVTQCRDDLDADSGYFIRKVTVKARYFTAFPTLDPGTTYSPELRTMLLEKVHEALVRERNREVVEGGTELSLLKTVTLGNGDIETADPSGALLRARAVFDCVEVMPVAICETALGSGKQKCVDITIKPISIRIDSAAPSNLLNAARSNKPTAFSQTPGWLRAFNLQPGLEYDRRLGIAERFSISSNLLDLRKNLNQEALTPRKTALELTADASKSQNHDFYEGAAQVSLARRFGRIAEEVALTVSADASHQPLGQSDFLKNEGALAGRFKLNPNRGPINSIVLGAGYQWSGNRLSSNTDDLRQLTRAGLAAGRLIADGVVWSGMMRLGLWSETGKTKEDNQSYRRLAGVLAYSKELPIAPNQTLGIEMIVGGGRSWGAVPDYARFYGGNSARGFIYEPSTSPRLSAFPIGPLIRSFGSNQMIPRGTGASYWHANLNTAVPIPKWSYPLVPDIDMDLPKKDETGHIVLGDDGLPAFESKPLKSVIKGQADTARRSLRRIYIKQGMEAGQAEAKATRDLKDINSILSFIADRANLYSVKPLLMVDAAQIDAQRKYAIGGGLQLTVVIMQAEFGYQRTVRPSPDDNRGNLVWRIVFKNFF